MTDKTTADKITPTQNTSSKSVACFMLVIFGAVFLGLTLLSIIFFQVFIKNNAEPRIRSFFERLAEGDFHYDSSPDEKTDTNQQNYTNTSTSKSSIEKKINSVVELEITDPQVVMPNQGTQPAPIELVPIIEEEPFSNCIQFEIPEGQFKSNGCYESDDYSDLRGYLGDYSLAKFTYEAASATIEFVCDGSEFFAESCEEAKDRKDNAEDEMDELENKIEDLIQKGQ